MDMSAIEARLEAAENVEDFPLEYRVAAKRDFNEHAPEDIRALIEEVGRLTVEHLEMRIERDNLRERRDYYRKAVMEADGEIEAVEALHAKQTDPEVPEEKPWWGECRDAFGISLFWPCPTMRALGVTE